MEIKENDLLFAKVKPNAIIPTKDDENAGYDIYACFDEDYIIIPSFNTVLVPTGIASALDNSKYIQIEERGSTGSKGMKRSAGVIDASYRGEWFIAITNCDNRDLIISKLTNDELSDKYGYIKYGCDTKRIHGNNGCEAILDDEYLINYPYSKAIAQAIVHEVHNMNVSEIPYEELLSIESKRGLGALGSSTK